jgi:hypothetical protein
MLRTELETQMFDDKRRELEKQAIQENRLPPGQSRTIKFPVLHYGQVPRYDLRTWASGSRQAITMMPTHGKKSALPAGVGNSFFNLCD